MSLKRAPVGIFALCKTAYFDVVADPFYLHANVDGWRIRLGWDQIQPNSSSEFLWQVADDAMKRAHDNNKRVALSIMGGTHSPDWLFNTDGCQSINTATGKLPIPGDTHYINRYSDLVAAFGAKYDAQHDNYYTVIGGIGATFEWYYGDSGNQQTLHTTYGDNVFTMWENQAKTFIDAYAQAFPTTRFMGAISKPFPAYALGDAAMERVANYGINNYRLRFGLTNSQLSATSTAYPGPSGSFSNNLINDHYASSPTGFQMLWNQTGDTTNRLNGSPASLGLDQSLAHGLTMHGRYVEVYTEDIASPNSALQSAISTYRTKMKAIPQPI